MKILAWCLAIMLTWPMIAKSRPVSRQEGIKRWVFAIVLLVLFA